MNDAQISSAPICSEGVGSNTSLRLYKTRGASATVATSDYDSLKINLRPYTLVYPMQQVHGACTYDQSIVRVAVTCRTVFCTDGLLHCWSTHGTGTNNAQNQVFQTSASSVATAK